MSTKLRDLANLKRPIPKQDMGPVDPRPEPGMAAMAYPSMLATNYRLIRLSRTKYPDLDAVWKRLDEMRNWKLESPVYRTERWWCKKVYP